MDEKEIQKEQDKRAVPVWYVQFPTYQYAEDVQTLAAEQGLRIVDARFQGDANQCDNAPALTLSDGSAPPVAADDSGGSDGDSGDADTGSDDDQQSNHYKLVDHFVEKGLTTKPGVGEMEAALNIDTNGAEIQAAWDDYKAMGA